MGKPAEPVLHLLELVTKAFMAIVAMIMKLAPVAAFGAIAYTVASQGMTSLPSLGKLMLCVYATMLVFVFLVLGSVMRINGLSLLKFIRYIREELLLVLGTSSSEAAPPSMIAKTEYLGCSKSVVGIVLPSGYSFNLDGACIYLTMAAGFLAQATETSLTNGQQVGVLLLLLLTSKGAAAVTGADSSRFRRRCRPHPFRSRACHCWWESTASCRKRARLRISSEMAWPRSPWQTGKRN